MRAAASDASSGSGRLAGKVAVITGAAKGIGKATATCFAREGAKVVLADVLENEAAAVAQQLTQSGYQAAACRCDVSSAADVNKLVQFTMDQYGSLDVLVANAGKLQGRDAGCSAWATASST